MTTSNTLTIGENNIKRLFVMIHLQQSIIKCFLAAATIIGNTKLSDHQALEKLDLAQGYEFIDQAQILIGILAKAMKPHNFDVTYHKGQLGITYTEEINLDVQSLLFTSAESQPETLLEFFFGNKIESDLYELPNDGSRPYRLRGNLLRKLSIAISTTIFNFSGSDFDDEAKATNKVFRLEEKYNAWALNQYTPFIKAELKSLPITFAKASKSSRVQLAQQLNNRGVYIDLLATQTDETVKALAEQLADELRSHLSGIVSVTLEIDYVDEPDGYIKTHIPDEASLDVLSMLMSPKLLSHDIKKLIGKSSLDTAIYKHLLYPSQSIVVFEGIGLSEITLATHIVIHVDIDKSI